MSKKLLTFLVIALAAIVTWTALGIQLYIFLSWALRHNLGVWHGLSYFLCYFTNISNLMAGLVLGYFLIKRPDIDEKSKSLISYVTAIAVFMSITGIVFNLLLQRLAPPSGIWHTANVLLHDVAPVMFLLFWGFCLPHGRLKFSDLVAWLSFPLFYFFCILVRGEFAHHYPYPFVNAAKLGYVPVMWNAFQMLLGFVVIGSIFVTLDRLKRPVRLE